MCHDIFWGATKLIYSITKPHSISLTWYAADIVSVPRTPQSDKTRPAKWKKFFSCLLQNFFFKVRFKSRRPNASATKKPWNYSACISNPGCITPNTQAIERGVCLAGNSRRCISLKTRWNDSIFQTKMYDPNINSRPYRTSIRRTQLYQCAFELWAW